MKQSITTSPNNYSMSELQTMATAMAKSKLFGASTPDQALSLMLLAQAEGLHPGIAARDYHIIQGKPSLKADAMLARFQHAGGSVEWLDYSDKMVKGKFTHPQGGTIEIEWSFEKAQSIDLTGKDTWKKYPRAMLRSRCISEGIRALYPGVNSGLYTPEEVSHFDDGPKNNVLKMIDKTEELDCARDQLQNCISLQELQKIWTILPKHFKSKLSELKDEMKEKLSNKEKPQLTQSQQEFIDAMEGDTETEVIINGQ